jgi:oxaloacetate decarboxylase gamma subunit
MTIGEMFGQSVVLTVLGMTVVFAFIWLMIICMGVFARLIKRLGWDKDAPSAKREIPANTGETIAPEIVAAISAAVMEYRKEGQSSASRPRKLFAQYRAPRSE